MPNCEECGGSGKGLIKRGGPEPGSSWERACKSCGGTGKQMRCCEECGGEGTDPTAPEVIPPPLSCDNCGGLGLVEVEWCKHTVDDLTDVCRICDLEEENAKLKEYHRGLRAEVEGVHRRIIEVRGEYKDYVYADTYSREVATKCRAVEERDSLREEVAKLRADGLGKDIDKLFVKAGDSPTGNPAYIVSLDELRAALNLLYHMHSVHDEGAAGGWTHDERS